MKALEIFKWLLIFLFVFACHDNTTIPLGNVKQNSAPSGFRIIYRQPQMTQAFYALGYKFPYYKSLETGEIAPGGAYKDSDYIKIPADGELEISGNFDARYQGTKLFVHIDGKYSETLINASSRDHLGYGDDFRVKNVLVKKSQKLTLFSPRIDDSRSYPLATVRDLIIYFKPELEAEKRNYYYYTGPDETFISVETSRNFGLHLPKDPHAGRIIMIKRGGGYFKVWGNGSKINTTTEGGYTQLFSIGYIRTFIFDGVSTWHSTD